MAHETEFFDVIGPDLQSCAALAVTSTTAKPDLSADAYVGKAFADGQFIRLYADGCAVYYGFSINDSTVSALDDTATGATAGKCQCIPSGFHVDVCMPWRNGTPCKYLYYKAASGASGVLRISPSSQNAINRYGQ
jgi:hypothetical protein